MERDCEMPYDADLLGQVIDDRNIPPKHLAYLCGIHKSTIYRYLSGEKTLPSTVLRTAFEATGDIRLLALITGRRAVTVTPVLACPHTNSNGAQSPATPVRIPPIEELFPKACKAVEAAAKGLPYMGKILSDGKLDKGDRADAEQFKRHSSHARSLLALSEAAVDVHIQKGARA